MKIRRFLLPTFIVLVTYLIGLGNVSLPEIFGDNMVLQRNAEVNIWGWAKPNETVKITTSWDDKEYVYETKDQGTWHLKIATSKAKGKQQIVIKGYNTIIYNDVLLGEVWLASGQSNMEWSPNAGIDGKEDAIAAANHPEIRLFGVSIASAEYPQQRLEGNWKVCTPETMANFSAIAYFFAKKLHVELGVPIGIINSSWGGTPGEAWVDEHSINLDRKLSHAASYQRPVPWGPHQPGRIYNAMINPLIPFNIKGVLWYQGESNTVYPTTYGRLLKTLAESWRKSWGYEFPFLYVQIAPYKYGKESEGVLLRESQRLAGISNATMVAINDIGNVNDIHPTNKIEVGLRLANVALHKTYQKKIENFTGPLLDKVDVKGNKFTLKFIEVGKGLKVKEGSDGDFIIAGSDGIFKPAKIKVDGQSILVWSDEIDHPKAVRHGWSNVSEATIFNSGGLPLSSFRTDDWKIKGFGE